MEFKTNVSVCRKTCSNFDVSFSCPTNETESRCDCQEGFVLSQETCIPMQECGCTYQGHYINVSHNIYIVLFVDLMMNKCKNSNLLKKLFYAKTLGRSL